MKNILKKRNKNTYLKDKITALKKMAFEKKKSDEFLNEEKYRLFKKELSFIIFK